jgi:ribosomal protein L3 glutamine methyltransferase
LRDWLRFGATRFNEAQLSFGHGTDNAWDEALLLSLFCLHLPWELGEKLLEARLTLTEKQRLVELFQTRIDEGMPAAYLTNQAWFAGLSFYVDERVLIPRSPIAELIEQQFAPWAEEENTRRILDIGTGSGCIAIACGYYFPAAQVEGIDIDADSLQVAEWNRKQHPLQERVKFYQSDLFTAVAEANYDIIIANPPYVDAEAMRQLPKEYLYEPQHALAGGEKGLDYINTILQQAAHYLSEHGILVAEVGASEQAFIEHYPRLEVTWPHLERGGEGVFVVTQPQLVDYFQGKQ